jgi:hypothetical protein
MKITKYPTSTEVELQETLAPTKRLWTMRMMKSLNDENVSIHIFGANGGPKAIFSINYHELKDGVNNLEGK